MFTALAVGAGLTLLMGLRRSATPVAEGKRVLTRLLATIAGPRRGAMVGA